MLLDAAVEKANDWENEVDKVYGEEDALAIVGMLSYLENIEGGFGHRNDEKLFKSEKESDVNDVLYEEALKGFELSKKCIHLRGQLREVSRIQLKK